jgi:hypothetical protein
MVLIKKSLGSEIKKENKKLRRVETEMIILKNIQAWIITFVHADSTIHKNQF